MKKFLLTFIIALLSLVNYTWALEYSILFELKDDFSVEEKIEIEFGHELTDVFSFYLPYEKIKVYVDGKEVNFSSYKIENYYLFKIPIKNSKKLLIYLAPNDVIFHRDKELVFITELDIPTENSTIIFKVPSGFAITDFYPEFGELKTDGKTISVIWKNVKGKEVFAVYFHPLYSSPNFSQIIFILIVSLLVILFIFVVHLRKVKLKSILSAFPERDREIVEFVLKKKILYQKDMEKKFKISRVRAHRIAKRLEKLGVVKREKLGRKVKLIVSV